MECRHIMTEIADSMLARWSCEAAEGGSVLITTDTLLPNNDCVEILVEPDGSGFLVSDMGMLSSYFFLHGIDLDDYSGKTRLARLKNIIKNYGAEYVDSSIQKEAKPDEIPLVVNMVVQAVREASVIQYTIRPHVQRSFKDSVYTFLKNENAKVKKDVEIPGMARNYHVIDIHLNGSSEVLAKTISAATSYQIQNMFERAYYIFSDLRESERDFSPVIILDDTEKKRADALKPQHFSQIRKAGIKPIRFKGGQSSLRRMAAEHRNLQ